MSLGGLGDDYSACAGDPLHQAICNSTDAGVVYTAAAGNNGWDWGAPPPDVPGLVPRGPDGHRGGRQRRPARRNRRRAELPAR